MTRFDILTLFPEVCDAYFHASILGRAQQKKLIKIATYNIRDFARDKHRKVDDTPYGGGAGMVLKAEPLARAVEQVTRPVRKGNKPYKLVVFSPKGKQFTQKIAYAWAKKYRQFIFVSGRYEGIDERVKKVFRAEEISIGPYVITDGDVAAMTVVSAVARLIPGVIRLESLAEESHWSVLLKDEVAAGEKGSLEYPHYTRPEIFVWRGKKYRVPKVLLSGDHKKIAAWRAEKRTVEK